jgi:hypothetical protein
MSASIQHQAAAAAAAAAAAVQTADQPTMFSRIVASLMNGVTKSATKSAHATQAT